MWRFPKWRGWQLQGGTAYSPGILVIFPAFISHFIFPLSLMTMISGIWLWSFPSKTPFRRESAWTLLRLKDFREDWREKSLFALYSSVSPDLSLLPSNPLVPAGHEENISSYLHTLPSSPSLLLFHSRRQQPLWPFLSLGIYHLSEKAFFLGPPLSPQDPIIQTFPCG